MFSVRQEVSVLIQAGCVSHYSDYGTGWKTAELGFSCPQEHSFMCSVLCSLQTGSGASGCVHQAMNAVMCLPTSHLHQVLRLTLRGALFPLPLGVRTSYLIKFGYNFYVPFTVHRKPITSHLMQGIPFVFWRLAALSDVLLI